MAGITLSGLLVAGLFVGFITQRRSVTAHEQTLRIRHHLRAALESIVRDIVRAGYGIPVSDYWLPHWIDWEPGLTSNPSVLPAGSDRGTALLIAGAFNGTAMELAADAPRGGTTLEVAGDATGIFDPYVRKVIFLGENETIRVVSVSGSLLRISTHPTEIRGLRYGHSSGTPLEPVVVRRYEQLQDQEGGQRRVFLARTDSGTNYRNDWSRMVAKGIERVEFSRDGQSFGIEMEARAETPDPHYTHPVQRDHFRRLTMGGRGIPTPEGSS